MATEQVFVATETFVAERADGTPISVIKDQTHVRGDDEMVGRYPQFFRVFGDAPDVEQATAAPGEKRATAKPAAAAAPDKPAAAAKPAAGKASDKGK